VPKLLATVERLARSGRQVEDVIFGPSGAPEVLRARQGLRPYDAVMIDGDHSYDGVKRDFIMYAPLARMVILHDIAAPEHVRSKDGHTVEVPRFWREIKNNFRHAEIVIPDSLMGIGVLWRENS
jgi:hypothetical protein